MSQRERIEEDHLGKRALPVEARYGIHTARALENFPLAGRVVHPALALAFGEVKLACALTNRALGAWAGDEAKAEAIEQACRELSEGELAGEIVVDALQGGAGTSTNMNVNEVLANRALEILGLAHGDYGASLRWTTSICTSRPMTRIPPRCGWPRSGCCMCWRRMLWRCRSRFSGRRGGLRMW